MLTLIMPDSDSDFTASITPEVMLCLQKARFFDKLDDLLCPATEDVVANECSGDYQLSQSVLKESGFDAADCDDIFDVLKRKGACCDCEVLYNVAETSRLKAKYWRNRHQR